METQNIPVTNTPNNTPIPISGTSSESNFSKTVSLSSNETPGAYNFIVSMNNAKQMSTNDGLNNVMGPQRQFQEDMCVSFADPQKFILSNVQK